jgi:ParD-like antitoxin of type II bacterial toxin-antitoxin system
MAVAIKLTDKLVGDAKRYGSLYNRSIPKQIEYWSKIGKIAEENPELSYGLIKDILFSLDEVKAQEVEEYKFNSK